jgi:hypothetical protein
MSDIRHTWIDRYFYERPQIKRPPPVAFGYEITYPWKCVVERLLQDFERLSAELEQAHEQLDRFEALADKKLDQAQKRIERVEATLRKIYSWPDEEKADVIRGMLRTAKQALESIDQQDKINGDRQ